MAKIIDCKSLAVSIKKAVKERAASLPAAPTLAVIQVGNDPASEIYIRNKRRACEECGIQFMYFSFPETVSSDTLLEQIEVLNNSQNVDAIMVQCPLPEHLRDCPNYIYPMKDADCFTPAMQGCLLLDKSWRNVYSLDCSKYTKYNSQQGNDLCNLHNARLYKNAILPCTVQGVMDALHAIYSPEELRGKHAVVIGRSQIVGKPAAIALLNADCTVTVCHSHTANLAEISRQADILICAVGKPNFITADMVKPGAVVIDVGINRLPDGKVSGDVSFADVEPVASAITPVPGGIGVLTVANLMRNVVSLAEFGRQRKYVAQQSNVGEDLADADT